MSDAEVNKVFDLPLFLWQFLVAWKKTDDRGKDWVKQQVDLLPRFNQRSSPASASGKPMTGPVSEGPSLPTIKLPNRPSNKSGEVFRYWTSNQGGEQGITNPRKSIDAGAGASPSAGTSKAPPIDRQEGTSTTRTLKNPEHGRGALEVTDAAIHRGRGARRGPKVAVDDGIEEDDSEVDKNYVEEEAGEKAVKSSTVGGAGAEHVKAGADDSDDETSDQGKNRKCRKSGRKNEPRRTEREDSDADVPQCKICAAPVRGPLNANPCERCRGVGAQCYAQQGGKDRGACYRCGVQKVKCSLKDNAEQVQNATGGPSTQASGKPNTQHPPMRATGAPMKPSGVIPPAPSRPKPRKKMSKPKTKKVILVADTSAESEDEGSKHKGQGSPPRLSAKAKGKGKGKISFVFEADANNCG